MNYQHTCKEQQRHPLQVIYSTQIQKQKAHCNKDSYSIIVAILLYLSNCTMKDIQTAIVCLSTRVKEPDTNDDKNNPQSNAIYKRHDKIKTNRITGQQTTTGGWTAWMKYSWT